ncbi:MAG TPA: ATP-binding protein, partial [Polyangia bacterium]
MTDWLKGKGETAEQIRAMDWSATPLGPRSSWPQPLRTAMNLALATHFPTAILWGEELLLLYNDAYGVVAGRKHPSALGRSTREVWPEVWHINQPIFESVMKRGEIVSLDNKLFPITRNGALEDAYFTLSYCPIYLEDGAIGGSFVTLIETTAQVLREAELIQHEALMKTAIENLPLVFYMIDGAGIFRLSVGAGLKGLGLEQNQVCGLSAFEIYKDFPEITNALRRALAGNTVSFESRVGDSSYSNSCVPFRASDTGFGGVVGVALDTTENRKAEEEKAKLEDQLGQAQKMESIGRLAGGVAHDFNNMLGVILGHVELAMEELDPTQPIHGNLEEIQKAARRSADLTRQLLAFARKQTVAPKVLDLNQTVGGMLKMLRRLLGEDIDLTWVPAADLWPVNVDPSQIDQILANLCVNARDAIDGVGKMTIETDNTTFDHDYCSHHAGYVAGEHVQIIVNDSGCGMGKETLAHLFEPFFTTKKMGKGTGLGLATVYGIVKQNNGFINVHSEPGHGTTFKLYLPRHGGQAGQVAETVTTKVTGGEAVILLVEDEPFMLQMTKTMLERLGYTVVAASTPGEAIRVAREQPAEIHLLITDVVMPEMNGRDLARNVLSLYPRMKRLFMSGYTANVIAHHGVLD